MQNEEIIERLLDKAYTCYKRAFRKHCPLVARMLDRKESVEIEGQMYSCWQELIVVTCANIIAEYCPDIEIEVELDGNNSTLNVSLTEEDEKIIGSKIYDMVA